MDAQGDDAVSFRVRSVGVISPAQSGEAAQVPGGRSNGRRGRYYGRL